MTAAAIPNLLDKVWNYSLFDALYGRRTRRFGVGFEIGEGPFRYKSAHPPVALSEMEEALLVGAGAGFSGLALWELSTPAPYLERSGRTFPTTAPGGNTTLFFTNDAGFYVLDGQVAPSQLRELATPHDRDKLLAIYRERRRELSPGRLDIPHDVPPYSAHDLWDSNMPGSTLFMPVCDVSRALISLIAQFVDPTLRRYAQPTGGWNIVDDRNGFRSAGAERWLKRAFLDPERMMPLSLLERQACYYTFSEPAAICQNMLLATEALGLGGWKHCGFLSLEILRCMGFRIAAGGPAAFGNPIGLDGVLEARCPPYFTSMDAAVDSVLAPQLQTEKPATVVPHLLSEAEHRAGAITVSGEGLACTKAICNYIYETYGRFPGGTDAMHLMWFTQAHHIDTNFYDRFFTHGAYGPMHASHMATWHPEIARAIT
jgi:hypothetical protein